jgi:hypothetical protein
MSEKKQKDENLNNKGAIKAKNDEEDKKANDDKVVPNDNDQKENESNDDEAFDFDNLRLSQNFSELAGVKKAIIHIDVGRPNRQEFFRVRPGEAWRFETAILELKSERETYLVDKALWPVLANEIIPKVLFTVIDRYGNLSLWPVRFPDEDGRKNKWNRSAYEAALLAQKHWIRLSSNMSEGAYEVYMAQSEIPEPEWPEMSLNEILKVAFKDKIIQTPDHPVIQRLQGLI